MSAALVVVRNLARQAELGQDSEGVPKQLEMLSVLGTGTLKIGLLVPGPEA